MARAVLAARGDDRPVVVDSGATYFGTPVDDFSLVTGDDGVLTQTRFADWMARR
ncbi:NmrA-like protein [Mycobacteroides abscessus subsp. abscessus]|nr:NmrA-like protein [Mycobacteroides abscessus subsp. abscessus]